MEITIILCKEHQEGMLIFAIDASSPLTIVSETQQELNKYSLTEFISHLLDCDHAAWQRLEMLLKEASQGKSGHKFGKKKNLDENWVN